MTPELRTQTSPKRRRVKQLSLHHFIAAVVTWFPLADFVTESGNKKCKNRSFGGDWVHLNFDEVFEIIRYRRRRWKQQKNSEETHEK